LKAPGTLCDQNDILPSMTKYHIHLLSLVRSLFWCFISRAVTLTNHVGSESEEMSSVISNRVSYLNTTVKADIATLMAAYEIYVNTLQSLKTIEGLTTLFTL